MINIIIIINRPFRIKSNNLFTKSMIQSKLKVLKMKDTFNMLES